MPFKILKTEKLNSVTNLFEIEAPFIARAARAGQFVMLRINETGERIPLTIAKKNESPETITIIFQEAGKTTRQLAALKEGGAITDLIGPLGRPTDFSKAGKVLFIGGGVGTAEILPVIRYAADNANEISVIIGARSKELVILESDIRPLAGKLIVTTDDGSYGRKGFVTDAARELMASEKFDLVYTVGPDVMMKAVCAVTKEFGVKTLVSLDANMVDATGMCGTCRVIVGGKTKFTCVDGPEFDGHLVDWDDFLNRQKRFNREEKVSLGKYEHDCKCGRRKKNE